jgi:hypothetical protein
MARIFDRDSNLVAAVAADQYFNFGYYTDRSLSMLGQIKQAFGF